MGSGFGREYEKKWEELFPGTPVYVTPNTLPVDHATKPYKVLEEKKSAFDTQVGGSHYKQFAIQPTEFIYKNNLGFLEGNAIKYLTRWKIKGGLEDLKKARHYVDMLIEMETPKE